MACERVCESSCDRRAPRASRVACGWRFLSGLAVIVAVLLMTTAAFGQALPEGLPKEVTAGLTQPETHAVQPTVLVLDTWETVQGAMEPQVGGYMVRVNIGQVLVRYERVRTAGTSLKDAYRRLAESNPGANANQRIELGYWCTQQGLWDEARVEIIAALRLEPARMEARRLLQLIDVAQQEDRKSARAIEGSGAPRAGARVVVSPNERSLEGLSQETVATFVREVQPLVSNRCGNAACHGTASQNEFVLKPIAAGQRLNRLASDHNLSQLLRFIDVTEPLNSPLLRRATEVRGVHQHAFRGPQAAAQRQLLQDWISRAARELPLPPGAAASPRLAGQNQRGTGSEHHDQHGTATGVDREWPAGSTAPGGSEVRLAASDAAPQRGAVVQAAAEWTENSTTRLAATESDAAMMRRIVQAGRGDPFDPDVFNLRHHGVAAFAATGDETGPAAGREADHEAGVPVAADGDASGEMR
ncbi:MAG: hypothetical protein R3B90_15215 [Planctomycetaceae bacterium]